MTNIRYAHDNLCCLTIRSDTGQHTQFLQCFLLYFCIINEDTKGGMWETLRMRKKLTHKYKSCLLACVRSEKTNVGSVWLAKALLLHPPTNHPTNPLKTPRIHPHHHCRFPRTSILRRNALLTLWDVFWKHGCVAHTTCPLETCCPCLVLAG